MSASTRQPPLSVRLEPELSQWVRKQAKAGDRSINAELNRIVRQAKEGTIEKTAYERGKRDGFELASNP